MPKKDFKNTAAHLDRFFSDTDTQDTLDTQDTPKGFTPPKDNPFANVQLKPGMGFPAAAVTPPPAQPKHYRLNLKLDASLKDYLQDASWKSRKSITQYINDLIQADKDTRDTQDTQDTPTI